MQRQELLKWCIAYLLIGGLLCVFIYFILSVEFECISFISLLGSYSSVFGLIVMAVQFQSVRTTTEETRKKIDGISLISDWSRAIELMRGIETDIKRDIIPVANYKLKSVKDIIIKTRSNDTGTKTKELDVAIKKINGYIDVLNQYELNIGNPNNAINKNDLLSGIEKIIDVMSGEINTSKDRI